MTTPNFFTIQKASGLKLNAQKTDFNTKVLQFATFATKEEAQIWIEQNNQKFLSISTCKPAKLSIVEHFGGK